jgi:hypothetical protein
MNTVNNQHLYGSSLLSMWMIGIVHHKFMQAYPFLSPIYSGCHGLTDWTENFYKYKSKQGSYEKFDKYAPKAPCRQQAKYI